jgi:hypothetical protein
VSMPTPGRTSNREAAALTRSAAKAAVRSAARTIGNPQQLRVVRGEDGVRMAARRPISPRVFQPRVDEGRYRCGMSDRGYSADGLPGRQAYELRVGPLDPVDAEQRGDFSRVYAVGAAGEDEQPGSRPRRIPDCWRSLRCRIQVGRPAAAAVGAGWASSTIPPSAPSARRRSDTRSTLGCMAKR